MWPETAPDLAGSLTAFRTPTDDGEGMAAEITISPNIYLKPSPTPALGLCSLKLWSFGPDVDTTRSHMATYNCNRSLPLQS